MRFRIVMLVLIGATLFLQGCGTLKGASEGFKEDWKVLLQVDEKMREKMW